MILTLKPILIEANKNINYKTSITKHPLQNKQKNQLQNIHYKTNKNQLQNIHYKTNKNQLQNKQTKHPLQTKQTSIKIFITKQTNIN